MDIIVFFLPLKKIKPKQVTNMKEGLGDILYFLAMIAFFVISSIAKSKKAKKNAAPAPEAEPENYPDGTEATDEDHRFPWLDDIFNDEEEKETLQEETPTPPVFESLSEKHYQSTKKENTPKKREIFQYSEVEDSGSAGSYWDEEEFDLRRAVIFSEILKRPEL